MTRAAFHIHVGAHKTGTTHLPTVLAAMAPDLLPDGIRILPFDRSRPYLRRFYPKRGLRFALRNHSRRRRARRDLHDIAQGVERVVLSEENLLGEAFHGADPRLYPDLSRLEALRDVLGDRDVRLFMGLRPLDTFLPSWLFQDLRARPAILRSLPDLRRRVAARPPAWRDVLERIAAIFPSATLHVWTQDDYAADPAVAVGALTGSRHPVPTRDRPTRTMSPDPSVLEAARDLDPVALGAQGWREAIEALYTAHPQRLDSPPLLTVAEARALSAHFAEDLAWIESGDAVHRIRP
jgi:hypothetical protein